jgi:thioredoxin-like negative regulator of GroEL
MREFGIMLGRGDVAFQQGRYEDARSEYRRAVAIAPEAARANLAVGLAAFACGDFAEASTAIRAGVAAAPQMGRAALDLATTYGRAEDFVRHKGALDAHLAQNPDDLNVRFLAGFVRFFNGDREGGLALLRAYRHAANSDPAVHPFIDQAAMP